MQKVQTKDGSFTYEDEFINETYKSVSGAKEESLKKFVGPCLDLINEKKEIFVLDICFGLGYNTAALLDSVSKGVKVHIFALENDPSILLKILEINEDTFESYKIIKELIKNNIDTLKLNSTIKINSGNISITLIVDDARKSVKYLPGKFEVCFFDPFSPKKCPELWTEEFIRDIYSKLNSPGILTTYSCARVVRDNLKSAGFEVKDGPCVGRKAPSTIAIKV